MHGGCDDRLGAGAADHILRLDDEAIGERKTKSTPAVRIECKTGEGVLDCVDCEGGAAEGVFVRSELDGACDTEFPFDLLGRFPWLIRQKRCDVRGD